MFQLALSSLSLLEAVFCSSVPLIPCLVLLLIIVLLQCLLFTSQTCFCASQQNSPCTQVEFLVSTPSFCPALSSHYNCCLELYSSSSVLDYVGFYSSNSNLYFVPYCSIANVRVTKWLAFVNSTPLFSQICHILLMLSSRNIDLPLFQ